MSKHAFLNIKVEPRDKVVILRPQGRISDDEARELEEVMIHHIKAGRARVIMDMGNVPFITSACLGGFVMANRHGRERAGDQGGLCIVNPQPLVKDVLTATKLIKIFPVFASVEAALSPSHA